MIALTLLMLAQAPSPPAAGAVRILVLDVKSDSATPETTRAIRDEVAVELARAPQLSVLSTEDLRAAVSIEAESRALGCDSSSCLAEVGAALGARYIVHASVASVGGARTVYLNLFDTEKNEAVAREVVDAPSDAQLLAAVRQGAARIRDRVAPGATPAPATGAVAVDPMFIGGVIGAGAGALAAIVGGVFVLGALDTVNDTDKPVPERQSAQGTGLAASIVAGAGLVAAGGGVALAAWRVVE